MNEKVKVFLDAKKEEKAKKYNQEKNDLLLSLDLCEKVYSDNNEYTAEFPYNEYSAKDNGIKWFKKVPIEITDEEYEEIKKYSCIKSQKSTSNNTIATIFQFIACLIYIGGFFAGCALANVKVSYYRTEFSIGIAMIYWAGALISGTSFLGFAEIIKLLQSIKDK